MKPLRYLQLLSLGTLVALGPVWAENTAAVNEVLKLHKAGMGEEAIGAYITGKNVNYELSADNAIALRDQGLPLPVLNAMLASGRAPAPAAPAAPPAPTVAAPAAPAVPPAFQPAFQPAAPLAQPAPVVAAPVTPPGLVAQPAFSPDAAYFYQELSPYGRWILSEDNQWYWQPTVAVARPDWRPYWDSGHWVYTDQGWYWASDYPWGWAAFHYGRWHLHPHHGWIWFPDRAWAPAWVVWRGGGEYCGWAPLPPHAEFDVAGGFIFHGRHVDVGFDFGLDWGHFSFVYTRELGDPPRRHFRRDDDVRTVFKQTTIINNYSVRPGGRDRDTPVFNRGIDPERVAAGRGHAVETVRIEDQRTPMPNRGHERLDPHNRTLEVYRPRFGGGGIPGGGGEHNDRSDRGERGDRGEHGGGAPGRR